MLETETLFVTVMKETAKSLLELKELTDRTPGELIDRMLLKWQAKDAETASALIVEEIAIIISKLEPGEQERAINNVISVMQAAK